jgi:glycolate oxidase iron-sulfur subunit
MDLNIDQRELDACVSCALCLPHCPTYRVTGADTESPRGRIALMRAVQDRGAPVTDEVVDSFETCVQCRGCETACPSGVPFGHMMEATRETLAAERWMTPGYVRVAMSVLGRHRLLLLGSSAVAVLQRLRLVPSLRLGLPARLPIRRAPLRASGDDVHLFTGCVMDAWQRDTHQAVQRVIEATGTGVRPTGGAAPCCGAMHTHAGLGDDARALAERVIDALDDGRPVLVDSAGCGAALKDYGHLLGSPAAIAFSARVLDVHEWLADRLDELPTVTPLDRRVAVQDPCHLRHVQKAHESVRTVLAPFVREVAELDDEGLCCGAGGAYSVLQRDLASDIRDRKTASLARAGADEVASANPGCLLHLAAAGHRVRHPLEIVDEALTR